MTVLRRSIAGILESHIKHECSVSEMMTSPVRSQTPRRMMRSKSQQDVDVNADQKKTSWKFSL